MNAISPIGFENARELAAEELAQVGGGVAKNTFIVKGTTGPQGNDGEVQYDREW